MRQVTTASVLGVDVAAIELPDAVQLIIDAAYDGESLSATALAVHGLMTADADADQRSRLNGLDLVLPDGQPVRWALNWLHDLDLKDRVAGPDLMSAVCAAAAKHSLPIFLLGSTKETLARLSQELKGKFEGIHVAGTLSSRFRVATEEERRQDLHLIEHSGARILMVGLGAPRQEIWVYENRHELDMPMLAVGAAFDFLAGNLDRAPVWMRESGLEWLFRLGQEPRRLWKRYLLLNPLFLYRILSQKMGVDRDDPVLPAHPPSIRPG